MQRERRGKVSVKNSSGQKQQQIKAVFFVPNTEGSRLARELRKQEETLESLTGYKIKIVERGGNKLEQLLHQSNPWSGSPCERKTCLMCDTKTKVGKIFEGEGKPYLLQI